MDLAFSRAHHEQSIFSNLYLLVTSFWEAKKMDASGIRNEAANATNFTNNGLIAKHREISFLSIGKTEVTYYSEFTSLNHSKVPLPELRTTSTH